MNIEIHIPRPMLILTIVATFVGGMYVAQTGKFTLAFLSDSPSTSYVATTQVPATSPDSVTATGAAVGADTTPGSTKQQQAEENARMAREQREVIKRKVDILRGEVRVLDGERQALGSQIDPALEQQFSDATSLLNALLQDQKKAEQFLLASLNQIWEAEGRAIALGQGYTGTQNVTFTWPVLPKLGISAMFHDPSYEARFGFQHDAIDIPTPQMTIVRAAADGTVEDVMDHGLGFNYITIKHDGGYSTLYGHITQFIVHVGDTVKTGDPIGYSGGRPGTPGAGLSTGPHLHFGVFKSGVAVDPQLYLPALDLSQFEGSSSSQ